MKIIVEIGVNHFGNVKILHHYINYLKNIDIDGISIQILNKKKISNNLKNFFLSKRDIEIFFKKARKKFKYIGVGIHSWNDFSFLKKLKLDFIKILGSSFGDFKYFNNVRKTGIKKIYLSVLGKSNKEISYFIKKINKSNSELILTFLKSKKFFEEIKKIKYYRKKFKMNVAYGNHHKNLLNIPKVLKYQPSAIFFYVKMNRKLDYPDNDNAVPLKNVKDLINKIKKK